MSKVITYEEVSKHNTADDLWMIIHGKVYDCTKFLDQHPGGEEVMIDCGGIDATGPFDDIGHSEDAYDALKPLYVGDIEEGEAPESFGGKAGASATTGGEDNVGLIIAILVIVLAAVVYFLFF